MNEMSYKRVTKKESKQARFMAHKVLQFLHKSMKDEYRFVDRIVGSGKWNIILKEKNGWWDLDYQLLLTKKSKFYKKNGKIDPTQAKESFFGKINELYKNDSVYTVENSTTSITLRNNQQKYSFDFVIIQLFPDNNQIIRRNNPNVRDGHNLYTWNQLPKMNDAYCVFNKLSTNEKTDVIENYILPRKAKEKSKNENDPSKKSSSEIFVEEVNNYVSRKRNNRL